MKIHHLPLALLGLALLAASAGTAWPQAPAASAPARSTAAQPSAPDVVTLNFTNADIEGVVKVMGEISGKNFVLDPRVKGTINIISAKPIPRSLVYDVFLQALRVQGFTTVEERGAVLIVPEGEAKFYRPQSGGDGAIQTQVFALKHQPAAQMVAILRPLIAVNNTIAAHPGSNALIVTDYAANLKRIERIIGTVDQPFEADPVIIPLQHASAIDVAQTINQLLAEPGQAAAEAAQRFSIVADARTNSLLARAGTPSRLLRVRQLAAMLDSPTSAAGNIHVIYLKNAVATRVAEVLRAVYSGEAAAAKPAPAAAAPLARGQTAAAPAAAQPAALAPGIVQADAATNALIITAPDVIYNNLRAAVEKLDVRRAQVYVEALIAEVTADRAAEFGIQWQNVTGLSETARARRGFAGTNFGDPSQNIVTISQNPGLAGHGLNVGVVKGTITIPGVGEILNLGVLLRALESDANANILSTPTLLTLDNEEAKIVIGQNVPFITGQYAVSAAATTPTPFQTIERKDVGLTLSIRPQISEGGAVRLQIYQEVSSVSDSTTSGLITNKRSVESTVLVDDGQIVVIGGLIQDTMRDGVEKVPGLGDIPVLGALFRYNTRSRSKTNLMIFLRPVVLRSAQSAESITSDRYDYIMGEQQRMRPLPGVLPDLGAPALPPLEGARPPQEPARPQ
jgi:general secretion pathway protein D